ncbi:MAG: hypothetical protein COA42_16130 [Alteromonadaceae bacterium]|nr:MAG: hypothetical protein COA42_16130 [Alteromonadaceae bacterium]
MPSQIRKDIELVNRDGALFQLGGIKELRPNVFTDPTKTPLVNGSIIPLGDGYVLVMLVAH